MTLKAKAALTYVLPLLTAYAALVVALSIGGRGAWFEIVLKAVPASVLPVIGTLLQDIVPKPVKEFIVFFRLDHRLPGHRAYTKVCTSDPRISSQFLATMRKETRSKPERQNVQWYDQYRAVSSDPSVMHENFRYVAWRDLTSVLLILALISPLLLPMGVLPLLRTMGVAGGCLVAALLTGTAARHAATSLVRNVVSIAAAKKAS